MIILSKCFYNHLVMQINFLNQLLYLQVIWKQIISESTLPTNSAAVFYYTDYKSI